MAYSRLPTALENPKVKVQNDFNLAKLSELKGLLSKKGVGMVLNWGESFQIGGYFWSRSHWEQASNKDAGRVWGGDCGDGCSQPFPALERRMTSPFSIPLTVLSFLGYFCQFCLLSSILYPKLVKCDVGYLSPDLTWCIAQD